MRLPPALYSVHQSSRSFALMIVARSCLVRPIVWRPCLSSSFTSSSHLAANQGSLLVRQMPPPPSTKAVINRLLFTRHLQTSSTLSSQKPVISGYHRYLLFTSRTTTQSRATLSSDRSFPTESRSLSPFKVGGLLAGLGLLFYGFYNGYQEYLRRLDAPALLDYEVPPVPLPPTNAELLALPPNQRVILVGRFEHESEQFLGSRKNLQIPAGQHVSYWDQDGYYLLTPFVLSDGSRRRLLVNRGWIATHRREPSKRPLGQVEGEVELHCYVRPTEQLDLFTEARTMMRLERWHYSQERLTLDLGLLSRKLAVDPVALFVADHETGTVKGGPVGGQLFIPEQYEMLYIRPIGLVLAGVILIKTVFV